MRTKIAILALFVASNSGNECMSERVSSKRSDKETRRDKSQMWTGCISFRIG